MCCRSRQWVRPSALAPAVNPLHWILPVLPLPLVENKVGPHPGMARTKSLNHAHRVQKPFPQWTLQPLRNMVPARLQKVTMTVIKGVYHERFAVTSCIHFDYSQIAAQAFHRKSIGLGSVYKARPDLCIFCSFPNKTYPQYLIFRVFREFEGCFDGFQLQTCPSVLTPFLCS